MPSPILSGGEKETGIDSGTSEFNLKAHKRIESFLFLSAGGCALIADWLDMPWLFRVALINVGLVGIVGGIKAWSTRTAVEGRVLLSDPRYVRRFTGLPARLISAGLIVAGVILITLSIIDLARPGNAGIFMSHLLDSRYGIALILAVAGFMGVAFGIVRVIAGTGASPGAWARHIELGYRIWGASATVLGLAALAGAVLIIFAPELLGQLRIQARALIEGLLLR